MTFIDSIKTCFMKYADFGGRAPRSEYWFWLLFVAIASAVLAAIHPRLSNAISIATLLPSFAVAARRLHDIDRSGWWQLIAFIPIIGWIIMIVWCAAPGTSGANRFGDDPLAAAGGKLPSPQSG